MIRVAVLLLLSLISGNVRAQTVIQALQRHWICSGKSEGIDSFAQHLYDLRFDSSGNYTGKGATVFFVAGRKSSLSYRISGQIILNSSDKSVSLTYREEDEIVLDNRPEFRTCSEHGSLNLFRSKHGSEYYLLGKLSCDRMGIITKVFR